MAKKINVSETARNFLLAVHANEPSLLARIERGPDDAWMESDGFVFSIEALWRLCDPGQDTSLGDFRRALYASELNRYLAGKGLAVSVFRQTGKVDSNLYCLKTTSEGKSDC